MIIPFLDGFLPFRKIPITWILILFNTFLFSQNWQISNVVRDQFNSWYEDSEFLYTQGQVYLQYQKQTEYDFSKVKDKEMLGRLAFKDEMFLQSAINYPWAGDEVALLLWKRNLEDYLILREFYPAFTLGVSQAHHDAFSFVSYMFFHEGFWHLLGNVLLIMLVGGFLERRHSGLMVFGVYLCSGFMAAWLYNLVIGPSGTPLVGASGSLCGLMGFLLAAHFHEKTRLFYVLLPTPPYMGMVWIKTSHWLIWLFILEDIAGWLSRPEIFAGGVAHFVHLMGFVTGILLALAVTRIPVPTNSASPA